MNWKSRSFQISQEATKPRGRSLPTGGVRSETAINPITGSLAVRNPEDHTEESTAFLEKLAH